MQLESGGPPTDQTSEVTSLAGFAFMVESFHGEIRSSLLGNSCCWKCASIERRPTRWRELFVRLWIWVNHQSLS